MKSKKIALVSIVGRPNVGKSSLFNRIVGRREAVVEKREGTTRDVKEKSVNYKGRAFLLADTGGFTMRGEDRISVLVKNQIRKAVSASDVLLFVCDGEEGALPFDTELGEILRRSGKKIVLAVNKIDNDKRSENILDFYSLGLGEPFAVSSLHNRGIENLLSAVLEALPECACGEAVSPNPIKVAIVGRPNVGKSSLLNKILDEERVIVHEKPGTTRDSVDVDFEKDGAKFLLIDTAGIRHKRKVREAVDVYSVMRAKDAIERCDIALLVIDGMEGLTSDDMKIFDYIVQSEKGCVIVVNKWDIVKNTEMSRYKNAITRVMPQARNFPVVFVSAKSGRNVFTVFDLVKSMKTNMDIFLDSDILRDFLDSIDPDRVKVSSRKLPPRFYSITQVRPYPKEFLVLVNSTKAVTASHSAFMENRLRHSFPLKGMPVKLTYKKFRRSGKKRRRSSHEGAR
ncbi:MAG: ribosome biogenesis GTPase Der [Candidatus Omnitrophica bacterium]|nr:ribosome biogenesis GTPase Der [Candidatus Omnitrophota bacterium]